MRLLRNALGVGAATLASRILGFLRDGMLAAVLGSGPAADAFVVALRLPNLFRRLFAEGAFAAAFVPGYIAVREAEGRDAARRFAGAAALLLVATVAAITVAVWVFTEPVVRLLAPGYGTDPDKLALTVTLTRLAFPYLVGITVVALLGGVLAADKRFMAAAFAPILFNLLLLVAMVVVLVAGRHDAVFAGRLLAATVAVAGLAQAAFLVAAAGRAGALPLPARPRADPAMRRLARAFAPGLVAGGFAEIGIVVGTMIASGEPGAVSWLYYADRLYQLPLGLVGIAVGQVLLPEIAEEAGRPGDGVHVVQNRAFEFALALALPAAFGLVLLAHPIVSALFERGAFSANDAREAARALAAYALGLPAFVAIRLFSAAHWGRGDTRTPMIHGIVAVGLNVALSLALLPTIGWVAVAWATAASAWLNAGLLAAALFRRDHWRLDAAARRRLPRILAATLGMAAVVGLARLVVVDPAFASGGTLPRLTAVAAAILAGVAVHAGLLWATGAVDPRILTRRPTASPAPVSDGAATCEAPTDRA